MLGLINDCLEKLIISKFGLETWESVKQKARLDVKNNGFSKLECYHDDATMVLMECASDLTRVPLHELLRLFGAYFVEYIMEEGYDNLLFCHGRTLKEWMASINSIHSHLQTTFPNRIKTPEFWCDENDDGTLALFYMSSRGAMWARFAEGLITECAKRRFNLSITMKPVCFQGVEGARFTRWIVATENPEDLWRLRTTKGGDNSISLGRENQSCPFSGMVISTGGGKVSEPRFSDSCESHATQASAVYLDDDKPTIKKSPFDGVSSGRRGSVSSRASRSRLSDGLRSVVSGSHGEGSSSLVRGEYEAGSLSASTTRKIFPYHVVIDQDFSISQVGLKLASVLGTNDKILYHYDVDEVFQFVQPKQAKWTQSWMRKLEDQDFSLKCILDKAPNKILFKGTLIATNPGELMLVLCPEANNLEELRGMNLTMSDLPAHGAHRDAIFLREHLSKQLNNALKMEKLSKTLQTEKELLESLLPKHAVEGMRKGETVQPRIHHNVTMFFSDIVGFTNICSNVDPREVVNMLNRLYMVMDYLAKRFNLFKIETIGDAYVAASGLPDADANHAKNVANFAIAVTYIARRILSPLDGTPIKIRIGVNSGRCCSGIVGVTNPRYCVFGDTVNTTARHETTGEAGRVHSSMTTMIELLKHAPDEFISESRGLVEMKGKGKIPTYWLLSTPNNLLTNKEALTALDAEVASKFSDMLKQEDCSRRRKKKKAASKTLRGNGGAKTYEPPNPGPKVSVVASPLLGRNQMDSSTHLEDVDSASEYDSASSSTSCSSAYSAGPPGIGISGSSRQTPSKTELMCLFDQYIGGEGDLDDLVESRRETPDDEEKTELTGTVGEACQS